MSIERVCGAVKAIAIVVALAAMAIRMQLHCVQQQRELYRSLEEFLKERKSRQ